MGSPVCAQALFLGDDPLADTTPVPLAQLIETLEALLRHGAGSLDEPLLIPVNLPREQREQAQRWMGWGMAPRTHAMRW
jgi:hypothetical protein